MLGVGFWVDRCQPTVELENGLGLIIPDGRWRGRVLSLSPQVRRRNRLGDHRLHRCRSGSIPLRVGVHRAQRASKRRVSTDGDGKVVLARGCEHRKDQILNDLITYIGFHQKVEIICR